MKNYNRFVHTIIHYFHHRLFTFFFTLIPGSLIKGGLLYLVILQEMRPLRVLNDGICIYYSQLKWTFLILSSAPERYHEFIASKKNKVNLFNWYSLFWNEITLCWTNHGFEFVIWRKCLMVKSSKIPVILHRLQR